ncbi:MAG: tetrathionate reductase family octaheme c-type cytochrome [Candidatus Sedimenticola sp. PURPLELP]
MFTAKNKGVLGTALAVLVLIPGLSLNAATKDSTADHTKFEALQADFKTGPEVTKACLTCHTEASSQLHKTNHWTWAYRNEVTGQELGKKNVVNNFCVATATNWPRCTSCHIGYGWKDNTFDLTQETAVDCLVCHDTTGTYKKYPAGSGHPAYEDKMFPPKAKKGKLFKKVDLTKVAQNIGKTSRNTCGACHFYGGGGNGVKHGDLDSSMAKPDKALDVHMDASGLNFSCSTCHSSGSHQVSGSRYEPTAVDREGIDIPGRTDGSRATCESCHGMSPHEENDKLNQHTDRVACPTCHIPEFARGGRKTKTWWDWSTAGLKNDQGKGIVKKDADGYDLYNFKKGDFKWESNVTPEYYWFDGKIKYTLLNDKIDPSGVVPINSFTGNASDSDSRIWPFKVMRGRQPYDTKQSLLGIPHLFGKDQAAFWKSFDWGKALKSGLQARGVEFSGSYDFVETEYFWPISHMVAPKEDAMACEGCHAREGRLENLNGFYLPGRGDFPMISTIGWGVVLLTLLGVMGHALLRVIFWIRER